MRFLGDINHNVERWNTFFFYQKARTEGRCGLLGRVRWSPTSQKRMHASQRGRMPESSCTCIKYYISKIMQNNRNWDSYGLIGHGRPPRPAASKRRLCMALLSGLPAPTAWGFHQYYAQLCNNVQQNVNPGRPAGPLSAHGTVSKARITNRRRRRFGHRTIHIPDVRRPFDIQT